MGQVAMADELGVERLLEALVTIAGRGYCIGCGVSADLLREASRSHSTQGLSSIVYPRLLDSEHLGLGRPSLGSK